MDNQNKLKNEIYDNNNHKEFVNINPVYGTGDDIFEIIDIGISWASLGTVSDKTLETFKEQLKEKELKVKELKNKYNLNKNGK